MSHDSELPILSGETAWRSAEELANAPAFRQWVESEFPHVTTEAARGPSRRDMLRLMGSSLALAGMAAYRWPKEQIVPATRRPYNRIPGEPIAYATAMELGGVATGLLVTTYDGRPIKVEGNDQHPFSRGKSNGWMQAAILELYDPDRGRQPIRRAAGKETNRYLREFEQFAAGHFGERRGNGAGLHVLSLPSSSPTLNRLRKRFGETFPQATWHAYEPLNRDHEIAGAQQAFRQPLRPHLRLDQADVIVSLDSDFLVKHPAALRYASDFATRRSPDNGQMNRLYVVESTLSVTGSMADERHAMRSCDIGQLAYALLKAVDAGLQDGRVPTSAPAAGVDDRITLPWAWIRQVAEDLLAHRGHGVVVAGPQQPDWVHNTVHRLNSNLGNHGHTVTFTEEPEGEQPLAGEALEALVAELNAGRVDTLLILGGNPVYDAPADLDFAGALAKASTRIYLGLYDNETSRQCDWYVPQAQFLESWGDARAWDGTVSLMQPMIAPLYGGLSACELLARICGEAKSDGYTLTRQTFEQQFVRGADLESAWKRALHDGVVAETAWPERSADCGLQSAVTGPAPPDYEVVFAADYSVYDGRFANNGWLQEWPDPLTKVTWDNAALVSPTDAETLGVEDGDLVTVSVGERQVTLPAYVLPGQAVGSITVPLGYGRGAAAGLVATGVGFDVYPLRTSAHPHFATGAKVSRARGKHRLAATQNHHAIRSQVGDQAKAERIPVLAREATLDYYQHHPEFAAHMVHHPPLESLWEEKKYYDHKWGMAIDLNKCIGCGACVIACQAENNIPVVGKDEVALGREMHWIRIDRYFRGDVPGHAGTAGEQRLAVSHQPVACVHCETAPCEQVCPVAATVHDEEGLNVMVYNRCIGTRYCSNNCPYKVRRFNWFYNHHGPYHPRSQQAGTTPFPGKLPQAHATEVEQLRHSPYVTVRSRGVMEKCTFCVQRINRVKINARNERWEKIPDGLIVPACAQACPADAIVFGDLNDPESRVRKLHEHKRAYGMLAELNIKPRTRYLAKIRNPAGNQPAGEHGHGQAGHDADGHRGH